MEERSRRRPEKEEDRSHKRTMETGGPEQQNNPAAIQVPKRKRNKRKRSRRHGGSTTESTVTTTHARGGTHSSIEEIGERLAKHADGSAYAKTLANLFGPGTSGKQGIRLRHLVQQVKFFAGEDRSEVDCDNILWIARDDEDAERNGKTAWRFCPPCDTCRQYRASVRRRSCGCAYYCSKECEKRGRTSHTVDCTRSARRAMEDRLVYDITAHDACAAFRTAFPKATQKELCSVALKFCRLLTIDVGLLDGAEEPITNLPIYFEEQKRFYWCANKDLRLYACSDCSGEPVSSRLPFTKRLYTTISYLSTEVCALPMGIIHAGGGATPAGATPAGATPAGATFFAFYTRELPEEDFRSLEKKLPPDWRSALNPECSQHIIMPLCRLSAFAVPFLQPPLPAANQSPALCVSG